jgi:uncharacterized iron-regulated membrane protein
MKIKIRKIHRYLGIIIGIQFVFWTLSGLYFSWTNIDEIHGDHFKAPDHEPKRFYELISPSELDVEDGIKSLELREIANVPYYRINDEILYNAENGKLKHKVTEQEALSVAQVHMSPELVVENIQLVNETNAHHEYRNKSLPVYVISFKHNDKIKAYVSAKDGKFQTVRHRSWRIFDFLWMTHTMDYRSRDNFNTFVLRAFSFLGLITVLSGFILWFISSKTIRKITSGKK